MNSLTLTEISRRLNEPITTVVYWAKQISVYLRPQKPEKGRFVLYSEDDYTVLETARKYYREGKSTEVVRKLLAKDYGDIIEMQSDNNNNSTKELQQPTTQGTNSLATMAQLNNNLKDWLENQSALSDSFIRQSRQLGERVRELETEIAELQEKLKHMSQRESHAVLEPVRSEKVAKPTHHKTKTKPKTAPINRPETAYKPHSKGLLARLFG